MLDMIDNNSKFCVMKKILLTLAILFCSIITKSQNQKINPVWCNVGNTQLQHDQLSSKTSLNSIITSTSIIDPNGVIVIPVIFHILYDPNKSEQYINQSVINAQILRLNTDFAMQNTDINLVPGIWQTLTSNLNFQFKLACFDPNGLPMAIPGIVYKPIPLDYEFCDVGQPAGIFCGDAKLSALNGDDAWPTDTYLNIWVFDMVNSNLSGHATFPWERFLPNVTITIGGNPVSIPQTALDGIMLDYRVVGDPTQSTYHNKGRVLTHEVGHWLGLFHLFQQGLNNNEGFCSSPGDFVNDTPIQKEGSFGCPAFPLTDMCSPNYPGVMFMNYMDATQDDCMYFFTTGQKDRARSYFSETGPLGTRFPFLQNYFGIKRFAVNPHTVLNNTITVFMNNPACLPVTYSYAGPVTEVSHDDQKIVFSVNCGISGSLSLTAESGNYRDTYAFDFDNGACSWPKAYGSIEESLGLVKDHYGNPILYATELSFAPNTYYNHVGEFPNVSPITCIQYTGSGITNWIDETLSPGFAFNSGAVQLTDINTGSHFFVDGNTGITVAAPINLATDEFVLAETNTGKFITMTFTSQNNTTLYVRTSNTTISSTYIGTDSYSGKFNPTTNNILVFSFPNVIKVYHFDGISINYVSTSTLPISPPYNQFSNLVLVDNQDRIYFLENSILKSFNYQTGILTSVTATGFNNNNLQHIINLDPYTENRCLVYNAVDNYLYCVDVSNPVIPTSKRVLYSASNNNWYHLQAIFDNTDVYLTGKYFNQFQIGNQTVPSLPAYNLVKVFITKLNITGDFNRLDDKPMSFLSNAETNITINPVLKNNVKNLEQKKDFLNIYSLEIYNTGGQLIKKIKSNIETYEILRSNRASGLSPGLYFVRVVYQDGNFKTLKKFLQ